MRMKLGSFRGGTDSPTYFDVYANDILEPLVEENLGVTIPSLTTTNAEGPKTPYGPLDARRRPVLAGLLIADDVVVLATSLNMLRKQFRHLSSWARLWGLRFGISKCGVMAITPPRMPSNTGHPVVRLSGTPVPWVDSYTYLGTEVSRDLTQTKELRKRLQKTSGALAGLSPSFLRERRLSPRAKLTALYATVATTALWGSEVWLHTRATAAPLQRTLDRGVQWCLGLSAVGSSADARRMEARRRGVYAMGRRRQARALIKWGSADADHSWTTTILSLERHNSPQPRGSSLNQPHTIVSRIRRWFHRYLGVDILQLGLSTASIYQLIDRYELARLEAKVRATTAPLSTQRYITRGFFRGWSTTAHLLTTPFHTNQGGRTVLQMRIGGFWTLPRLLNANILSDEARINLQILNPLTEDPTCFCTEADRRETPEHLLLQCNAWTAWRPNFQTLIANELSSARAAQYGNLPEDTKCAILLGGMWPSPATGASAVIFGAARRAGIGVSNGAQPGPERRPSGREIGPRHRALDLRGPTHQAVSRFLSRVARERQIILSSTISTGLNTPSGQGPGVTAQPGREEGIT